MVSLNTLASRAVSGVSLTDQVRFFWRQNVSTATISLVVAHPDSASISVQPIARQYLRRLGHDEALWSVRLWQIEQII
jgi:tagatose-1,6-bisphosphate aldolase non-catalytic subunit AgaZ/GatZ